MKNLLLFLGALVTLTAQTAVKPEQIRAAAAPAVRLLAFDAAGRLTMLTVGDGVQIVNGALVAVASTPPVLVTTRLVRDASGNYPATAGVVTRNGITQERGVDYAITAGALVPATPWSAEDIVLTITAERAPVLMVTRGAP